MAQRRKRLLAQRDIVRGERERESSLRRLSGKKGGSGMPKAQETVKGHTGKSDRGSSSPPSTLPPQEPRSPRKQTHLFISYY